MREEWEEAQSTHRAQPFYLPVLSTPTTSSEADTALQLVARVTFTQALPAQTLTAVADCAHCHDHGSTSLALTLSAPLSRTQGHADPFQQLGSGNPIRKTVKEVKYLASAIPQ